MFLQQLSLPVEHQHFPFKHVTSLHKKPNLLLQQRLLYACMHAIILCFLFVFAPPAFAHKVYIYAWAQGEQICTESYFNANNKVKNTPVSMHDAKGKLLQSAITDSKGLYCFKAPDTIGDLTLTVNAGQGHKSSFTLPASSQNKGILAIKDQATAIATSNKPQNKKPLPSQQTLASVQQPQKSEKIAVQLPKQNTNKPAEQTAGQLADKISAQTPEQTAGQLADKISTQTPEQTAGQLADKISAQTPEQTAGQLADKISAQTPEQTAGQLADKISAQTPEQTAGQLADKISAQIVTTTQAQALTQTPEQASTQASEQASTQASEQALTQTPEQALTQTPEQASTQAFTQASAQTSTQISDQVSIKTVKRVPLPADSTFTITPELAQTLRTLIQEEIRQEVAPLYQQLAHQNAESSPSLTSIIGGLGWIAGLAALAYAYKRRKKV